ncbi:hypothetical protein AAFM49_08225 [Burkholderia pseudomallei]|uniref:hypothetical protein n=1 Tax=Burkholderia pseudomallei TaxID=28450 RepID=UPI00313DBC1F
MNPKLPGRFDVGFVHDEWLRREIEVGEDVVAEDWVASKLRRLPYGGLPHNRFVCANNANLRRLGGGMGPEEPI